MKSLSPLPVKKTGYLFFMGLATSFLDGLNLTSANIITYFFSIDASNAVKSSEHHELN